MKNAYLEKIEEIGAIITDSHIVYSSWRHGSAYVNKDAIYAHPILTSYLCMELSDRFSSDDIEVVVAPAVGGVILSNNLAHHLSLLLEREVLSVYADKTQEGGFVIKRGYDKLVEGKRVLVVEDVITTGRSVIKVMEEVANKGGNIIGLAVLCNRSGVESPTLPNSPKFVSLMDINLESWDGKDCPLCKKGIPINTSVGRGREFLDIKNINSI